MKRGRTTVYFINPENIRNENIMLVDPSAPNYLGPSPFSAPYPRKASPAV
jgi:hypothetical protein